MALFEPPRGISTLGKERRRFLNILAGASLAHFHASAKRNKGQETEEEEQTWLLQGSRQRLRPPPKRPRLAEASKPPPRSHRCFYTKQGEALL